MHVFRCLIDFDALTSRTNGVSRLFLSLFCTCFGVRSALTCQLSILLLRVLGICRTVFSGLLCSASAAILLSTDAKINHCFGLVKFGTQNKQ